MSTSSHLISRNLSASVPISSSSNYYCIQNHNCFTHSKAPYLPSSFSTAILGISCSFTPLPLPCLFEKLTFSCSFPIDKQYVSDPSLLSFLSSFSWAFPLQGPFMQLWRNDTTRPIITIRSFLGLNSFFRPEPALWSTPGRRNLRRSLSLLVISSFLGENHGIPLLRGVLSRTKNKI
jgi:hypothetical protein